MSKLLTCMLSIGTKTDDLGWPAAVIILYLAYDMTSSKLIIGLSVMLRMCLNFRRISRLEISYRFGRQQQLNEWRQTRIVSDKVVHVSCNLLTVFFNISFLALICRRFLRLSPLYTHCCRALNLVLARLSCIIWDDLLIFELIIIPPTAKFSLLK